MVTGLGFAVLLAAFLTALWLIPRIRVLAFSRGWVDEPDGERKLHTHATPAMGGLAIAGGVVVGFVLLYAASSVLDVAVLSPLFWVGALIMVGVGFYDDVRGLGAKGKFIVQLGVAYLLLHAGYRLDLSGLPYFETLGAYDLALYSVPLTLLWIVGIINAVNLIDGLDGLAGGIALIGFGALATIFAINGQAGVALLVLPVIGAILGFLWFNFNPASIFMGDTGSLLLGYMLAAYSLQAEVAVDPSLGLLVPVVVLGIPLTDTGLSIVRRLTSHKAVFAPDHDHIHHRLQGRFSVRGAVYTLYMAALLLAVTAVVLSQLPLGSGLVLFTGTVAVGGSCLWNLGYLRLRGVRQMAQAKRTEALSLRSVPAEGRAPVEGRRPMRDMESVSQDLAA